MDIYNAGCVKLYGICRIPGARKINKEICVVRFSGISFYYHTLKVHGFDHCMTVFRPDRVRECEK